MIRALALLLTVLTGFTGLVYEVAWQKYLATLLGSHSEATAAVLAIFLGGLSVGYALFGRVSQRLAGSEQSQRSLFLVYGVIEAGIGLYAFVFPLIFRGAQALSLWMPLDQTGALFAFDVFLAALLIGPPTVGMGATIPVLTQALARNLSDATRFHARVYAFNTTGAFVGALAAGFYLVPSLGLVDVLRAMGLLNLLAGGSFVLLGLRMRGTHTTEAEAPSGSVERFASYAAVALLTGFAAMTLQTVLVRLGGLALGASHFTFAMVVAAFVACIALGSFAVSALSRIPPLAVVLNQWFLAGLFLLLYWPLENTSYYAHVLRTLFSESPVSFYAYYLSAFLGVLLLVGPAVMLSGAVLPLLFHQLRREIGTLGNVAGRLYGWNTLGSLLGALLGGYALLFWLDLHAVYRTSVASLIVAAVLLTRTLLRVRWLPLLAAGLVPCLVIFALLTPWSTVRLASGLFRLRAPEPETYDGAEVFYASHPASAHVFYTDDPISSVNVIESRNSGGVPIRALITNGKPDGNVLSDYTTMAFSGLLPALFADRIDRSFVIGYGTGVTVGELAALEGTREITVAEISPGVREAAPFFDYANLDASRSPKVEIIRSDAYRALLRSEGNFDLIVSEPSNPWVTGVEMLYSREFLTAARDRLAPGGVYAQWFHSYEADREVIELVFRTYASVFEEVTVWYANGLDLLLLGFPHVRATDLDRILVRAAREDFRAGLDRCRIRGEAALLAHELLPLGTVHAMDLQGSIHTLLHPVLSDQAARAFYVGLTAQIPTPASLEAARTARRNSLIWRYADRTGGALSEASREAYARELCKTRDDECIVALAHWASDRPESPARRRIFDEAPNLWIPVRNAMDLFHPSLEDTSLRYAQAATEEFIRYYFVGAPFPRASLARVWQACEQGSGLRASCEAHLLGVERRLGDLNQGILQPSARASR